MSGGIAEVIAVVFVEYWNQGLEQMGLTLSIYTPMTGTLSKGSFDNSTSSCSRDELAIAGLS